MMDGIFHKRLKDKLNDPAVHQLFIQIIVHLNGLSEAYLLQLKIILKEVHLFPHTENIFPFVQGNPVKQGQMFHHIHNFRVSAAHGHRGYGG